MVMLSLFKKIIAKDPELTEVQQNVEDVVQGIKAIDFANFYEAGGVEDIPNATETLINGPILIPAGEYICSIGAFFQVTYGGNPSQVDAHLNIVKGTQAGNHFLDDRTFVLSSDHGSFSSQFVERTFILNTTGELFNLDCEINVVGGSGVTRNVLDSYIKTVRRFI